MPDISESVKKLYRLLIDDPDYQDTPSKSREEVVLGEATQRAKQHERNNIALSLAKAPLPTSTNGHSNGNGALGAFTNFLQKATSRPLLKLTGEALIDLTNPKNGITTLLRPLKQDISLRTWNKDMSYLFSRLLYDVKAIFKGVEIDGEEVNLTRIDQLSGVVAALMETESLLNTKKNMSMKYLADRLEGSEIEALTPDAVKAFIQQLRDKKELGGSLYNIVQDERMATVGTLLDLMYEVPPLPEGWEAKCLDGGVGYRKLTEKVKEGTLFDIVVDEKTGMQVLDANGNLVLDGKGIIEFVKGGLITRGGAENRRAYFEENWINLTEALKSTEGFFLFTEMNSTKEGKKAILRMAQKEAQFKEIANIDIKRLMNMDAAALNALDDLSSAALRYAKKKQDHKIKPEQSDDKERLIDFLADAFVDEQAGKGIDVSKEQVLKEKADVPIEQWGFSRDILEQLSTRFFMDYKAPKEEPISNTATVAALYRDEGEILSETDTEKSMEEILRDAEALKEQQLDTVMGERFDNWQEDMENPDVIAALEEYDNDPSQILDDYDALDEKWRMAELEGKSIADIPDVNATKIITEGIDETENASTYNSKYYREDIGNVPASGWLGQEQDSLRDMAHKIYGIDGVTEVFLYGDSVHDYRFAEEQPEDPKDSKITIGIRMSPDAEEKYISAETTEIKTNRVEIAKTEPTVPPNIGDDKAKAFLMEFEEQKKNALAQNAEELAASRSRDVDKLLKGAGVDTTNLLPTAFRARYYAPQDYDFYGDTIVFGGKDFPRTELEEKRMREITRSQHLPIAGNDTVGGHDQRNPLTISDDILTSDLNKLLGAEEGVRIVIEDAPFKIPLELAHHLANNVDPDIKALYAQIDHLQGNTPGTPDYAQYMSDGIFGFLGDSIFPNLRKAFNPSERDEKTKKYVTKPVSQDTKDEVYDSLNAIFGTEANKNSSLNAELKKMRTLIHELREKEGEEYVATPERRQELSQIISRGTGEDTPLTAIVDREKYEGLDDIVKKLISEVPVQSKDENGDPIFEEREDEEQVPVMEDILQLNLNVHRPGSKSYRAFINKEINEKINEISTKTLSNVRKDIVLYDESGKRIPIAILLASLPQLLGYTEPEWETDEGGVKRMVGKRERQVNPTAWDIHSPVLVHNTEGDGSGRWRINEKTGEIEYIRPAQQGAARDRFLNVLRPLVDAAKEDEQAEVDKNWHWEPPVGHHAVALDPNTGLPLEADREGEALGGNIVLHRFVGDVLGLNPDTRLISFRGSPRIGNTITGVEVPEGTTLNEALLKHLQNENMNELGNQLKMHTYSTGWSPTEHEDIPVSEEERRAIFEETGIYQELSKVRKLTGYQERQKQVLDILSGLSVKQRDAVLAQWDKLARGVISLKDVHLGVSVIGSGVGMEIANAIVNKVRGYEGRTTPTITLKSPQTPIELHEAERRVQQRREFHRGRPFTYDLTDPDFQTFMKHVLRGLVDWEGTSYNAETGWGDDPPDRLPLSRLIPNAKGVEQEVPIGTLVEDAANQIRNSTLELHTIKDVADGGTRPAEELEQSYLVDNEEGFADLARQESVGDLDEDFKRRVFINHFIRKQLEGEVGENWLSEDIRDKYTRIMAGIPIGATITEEEAEALKQPRNSLQVIRAFSDADALAHAADGNLDVGREYFDDDATFAYFVANYKPFKALADHLGHSMVTQPVRTLFEQEHLIPTQISHALQTKFDQGGAYFSLEPKIGVEEAKIGLGELKTFLRKYMSHSMWGKGDALRSNADNIGDDLIREVNQPYEGHLETKDSAFRFPHEVLPTMFVLTRETNAAGEVTGPLRIQKLFNFGFDENNEPIYDSPEGRQHPFHEGASWTTDALKSFKTLKFEMLDDDGAYGRWNHRRASVQPGKDSNNKAKEPNTELIDFTNLNKFLADNRIGMGVDAAGNMTQALQFNTDVNVSEVEDIRRWVTEIRSKVATLKAMHIPIRDILTGDAQTEWNSLMGAAGAVGEDIGQQSGYKLDALLTALGHLTYGDGGPSSYRIGNRVYNFVDGRIGREEDGYHNNLLTGWGKFKNAKRGVEGTTYQTNLNYQDDLLARIEKTLGNMPEDKLQEIFGANITNFNRLDALGVIMRDVKKIKQRGLNELDKDSTFDYDKHVNNAINSLLNTVYREIGPYDANTGINSSNWDDQPLPMENEDIIEQIFDHMKGGGRLDALTDLQKNIGDDQTRIQSELRGDKLRVAAVMGKEESGLTDQEREVLASRFGLDIDPETGEQTNRSRSLREAGRELNLTYEWIRQIEKRAFAKLQGLSVPDKEAEELRIRLQANEDTLKLLNNFDPGDIFAGNIDPVIKEQIDTIVKAYPKFPAFLVEGSGVMHQFSRPFSQGAGPIKLGSPAKFEGLPIAPNELLPEDSNQRYNFLGDNLSVNGHSVAILDVEYNPDDPEDIKERYHIRMNREGKLLGHLIRDNGTYSVYRAGDDFLESTGGLANTSAPATDAEPIWEGLSKEDIIYKVKHETLWTSPIDSKVTGMRVAADGVEPSLIRKVAIANNITEATLKLAEVNEKIVKEVIDAGGTEADVIDLEQRSSTVPVGEGSEIINSDGDSSSVEIETNKIADTNATEGTSPNTAENRGDDWLGGKKVRVMAERWTKIASGNLHDDAVDHVIPILKYLTQEPTNIPEAEFGLNVENLQAISDRFKELGLHGGWDAENKATANSPRIPAKAHVYSGMGAFLSRLDNLLAGNQPVLIGSEAVDPDTGEEKELTVGLRRQLADLLDDLPIKDYSFKVAMEGKIRGWSEQTLHKTENRTVTNPKDIKKTSEEGAGVLPPQIRAGMAVEEQKIIDDKSISDDVEINPDDLRKKVIRDMEEANEIDGVPPSGGSLPLAPWKVSKNTAKRLLEKVATRPHEDPSKPYSEFYEKTMTTTSGGVPRVDSWHPYLYLTKPDPTDPTGKRHIYNEDFLGMNEGDPVKDLFRQLIGPDGNITHHDSIHEHADSVLTITEWLENNFQNWNKGNKAGPPENNSSWVDAEGNSIPHPHIGKLPRILNLEQLSNVGENPSAKGDKKGEGFGPVNPETGKREIIEEGKGTGVLDRMHQGRFGVDDNTQVANSLIYDEHMRGYDAPKVEEEAPQPIPDPAEQQVDPIQDEKVKPTSAWDTLLDDDQQKALGKLNQTKDSFDVLDSETQQKLKAYVTPSEDTDDAPEDTDDAPVDADVGGDDRKEPPTGPDVVTTSEDGEEEQKRQSQINKVMKAHFGDNWKEDIKTDPEIRDVFETYYHPKTGEKAFDADWKTYTDAIKKRAAEKRAAESKSGEAVTDGDVSAKELEDLKIKYREAYKRGTSSIHNPNGIALDEADISDDPNTLQRDIEEWQRRSRVETEDAEDNIRRTKANDLSDFIPQGGIPDGLSARVLNQLARKAILHQGKYDTMPDRKGKPFMENESKEILAAFWDDISARTDAQGNPLVSYDALKEQLLSLNNIVPVDPNEPDGEKIHAFEKVINEEDVEMKEAEANHKALVNHLNEEGVDTLNYPINGHNILVSPDGQHELEFGTGGEYNHHQDGRNRDVLGNLHDERSGDRLIQAPQVFGLNFEGDEDRTLFKKLWNEYYQISNRALIAQEEGSGYDENMVADVLKRQQALGQQITDNYGSKGFEADWLKDAEAVDEYGPKHWDEMETPIERNHLGFPIDEEGKPFELATVIDPETGEEVDGWYSPSLHAVVNERYLRTLFEESTKYKTNPLYGDHNQIKMTPTDLRRRGAGNSVGANLEVNDPRLQLIQPLPGSPLYTDKAIWLTREGGIYNVPSLENFTPPSAGPIDSAAFRKLVLMHKVADEMAQNPQAFTGNIANLSGYSALSTGTLDSQQWAGDQEAVVRTPTVKRMVRNSPSAKQTIKEQIDNQQASPTARFLASLGGYTKETAGQVPTMNILTALARDTAESVTGKRGLIPATEAQQNLEMDMAGERDRAANAKQSSKLAETLGWLNPNLVTPRDPKEKQVGVGEYPEPRKHPFEEFKPENIPEVEQFNPVTGAVGALGRFARRKRKPESESFTPPPSMPVEGE